MLIFRGTFSLRFSRVGSDELPFESPRCRFEYSKARVPREIEVEGYGEI